MIAESLEDRIMQEDLELLSGELCEENGFPLAQIANSTVFVSGATGLLGSQVVKALACFNRLKNTQIKMIALVRSMDKAKKVFGDLLKRGDITLMVGDVNHAISCPGAIDYVIHGASATSSRYFVEKPVETIGTALDGTRNVLEFARDKRVRGMVYLSSLEVYGTPLQTGQRIAEADYGYIDPLSVRSSYSESKRMAECLCVSYAKEYGVPVKVARLSQTFGAGVSYDDGRVFAEFARCAVEGRDIVLHTQGNTVRSYCYSRDAVSAILYILLKGEAAEAYNVTNMDTAISIREMAELVAQTLSHGRSSVVVDIPDDLASFGYNPEMVIRLDAEKLERLGWRPTVGLQEMYERMAASSFQKSV